MSWTDESRLSKSLTLAAMSLGFGVVQLDVTIVNTALNSIGTSLGGGVSGLQWVVSAYTIAFAALILTAGALGDRLGAKGIFIVGFAVFTLASLACALAPTSTILIAARTVQGVGAAILVPHCRFLTTPIPTRQSAAVPSAGGLRAPAWRSQRGLPSAAYSSRWSDGAAFFWSTYQLAWPDCG